MSIALSPARAAASRRNGAKSQGPRSADGKARAAKNALRHGLCAQKHVLLADEDAQAFAALEATLLDELAPQGALQRILVGRIVRAAWRLERAERIEAELFAFRMDGEENLALALIRDGNGTRSFDTLMRYRGSALAEFFRALRTLKALQAEAKAIVATAVETSSPRQPNEPDSRGNPGESGSRLAAVDSPPPRPEQDDAGAAAETSSLPKPNEPESSGNPGAMAPRAGGCMTAPPSQ